MVLNAQGQLVPLSSLPPGSFGYVRDPMTGALRPATSLAEGLAAGQQATSGASGGQMVLNAQGQLVPLSSLPPGSFGYVRDPMTGVLRPATSLAEGLMAGQQAMSGASGGQMVLNAQGQLVPLSSLPPGSFGYVRDPITGALRPATSLAEGLAAGQQARSGVNPVAGGVTSLLSNVMPTKAAGAIGAVAGLGVALAPGISSLLSSKKSSTANANPAAIAAAQAAKTAKADAKNLDAARRKYDEAEEKLDKAKNDAELVKNSLESAQKELDEATQKASSETGRAQKKAESARKQAQKEVDGLKSKLNKLEAKVKTAQTNADTAKSAYQRAGGTV
jgi:hypothetical protein